MSARASIVWFRQDLRLEDHPALRAAVQRGGPIIPVFIWSPEEERAWAPGAASRWWLRRSLARLNADLRQRGSRLSIRQGISTAILQTLVRDTGADAVFWNRRYEPAAVGQERTVQTSL
jgi:deoxyribodipyrimidine photo-lyase